MEEQIVSFPLINEEEKPLLIEEENENEFIFNELNIPAQHSDTSLAEADLLVTTTNSSRTDPLTGCIPTAPLGVSSSNDVLIGTAQTDNSRILEVTGQGIVSVPTSTAQVQVGIEVEGATASEVQQEIAQLSSAVVDQLNQLGVEELQTIRISLEPRIQFDEGESTVVGFTGRNVLQFEIPTEQAGETIDLAIQAGANLIQNINFIAPETELNQARLDALQLAVQDAQNQAIPVFNTLDLKPLEIIDIDIIGVNSPPSASPFLELRSAAFDASTPIIGGPQEVIANVALDISYDSL